MMARFVGGTWDGKTLVLPYTGRYYMVPLPPTTGSIEDFLDLDYKPKYKTQRYRRGKYDHENDAVTFTFEGIE